ncbi:MAG: hypothetical protein JWP75_194 [Frondihabitans sp.]|nr:hypothetical protein [Frondihabitans sp.]
MRTSPTRLRFTATAVLALALGATLAGITASSANAAEINSYGTFTLSGPARAYTGTMTLPGGFPETTFTSTSRQATIVSGASTWQAPSTPPGAVYGSSQGRPYLNQRPNADNTTSPAITTYTFATPSPASGWSFVLGDIDADQATITATDANGSSVPVSALGFQSVFNYCHKTGGPSCDSANVNDVPSWNPATATLTGNIAASDTEGASGWFSPTVPLKTLTITYQQRSGLPVYQTWFATKTFAPSGVVSVNGKPYGGAALTVTDASGAIVGTTTSNGDGSWSLPGLVSASGYHVSVGTPPGATAATPLAFDTLTADAPNLDFSFTIAPVTVTTTISDAGGQPIADQPIVITRDGDDAPTATTTTDATGGFTADLLPEQKYTAVVDGATHQEITFTTPATSGTIPPLTEPTAPTPPPTTPPTPPATPTPTTTTTSSSTDELAFTGSQPALPLGIGILLVLVGGTLLVRRRMTR